MGTRRRARRRRRRRLRDPTAGKGGRCGRRPAAADADGTRDGAGAQAPARRGHRRNHAAVLANANGGPSMASLLRKLPSFSEIVAQVASPSSAGAAAEAVAEELRAVNAAGLVQIQLLSSTLSRSRLARQAPDLRWRAQIGGVVAESCCGRRRADGGAGEDAEGEEWEWEHWVWLSVPAADAAAAEGDAARAPSSAALATLRRRGAPPPDGDIVGVYAVLAEETPAMWTTRSCST